MAVLFAAGSACFTGGALASQWASSPRPAIGVTFFVGSISFTGAAYLQYAEAVNVEHSIAAPRRTRRWRLAEVCHRWFCVKRRSLSWRIVAINLLGSIAFGVSAAPATP